MDTPSDALFTIRLTGDDVSPSVIAASDLAELIIAVEQSILAILGRDHAESTETVVLGLTAVQNKSVGLAFTSDKPAEVLSAYEEFVSAARLRDFERLPARSLDGLRTLTRFARSHDGHTQFWNGSTDGPLLDLPPTYAVELPAPDYERGETVLYGKIERVGGVRPRVRLRVSAREIVYADVDEEQSRVLGGRLYSQAALRGQATWDAVTGGVVYFRVDEILEYESGSIIEAFEELALATGGAFSDVTDVDEYARQIREGDLL